MKEDNNETQLCVVSVNNAAEFCQVKMRKNAKLSISIRKLSRKDTKNTIEHNEAIYKESIHAEQRIYTITGGGGSRKIRGVTPETRMARSAHRSLKNAKH